MTDTTVDSTTGHGKQAASNVADHARGKAAEVGGTAKSEARSIADDAKSQAADVLGTARSELRERATEQTRTLSSTLDDIGRQLGNMADSSDEPEAQMATLARSAADSLSKQANRLDKGGFDGVVDDVKRFARNRPGAFLLGSVAAGFAIGRLAKHADLQQAAQHAKGELGTDGSDAPTRSTSDASDLPSLPAPDVRQVPAQGGQRGSGRSTS